MSSPADALAKAAQALVGCPFRLHGRDPAIGLDCVGLVASALARTGVEAVPPSGYGLRNIGIGQWLPLAHLSGLRPAPGPVAAGDVLLIALAHCQHHLVIAADTRSVIHAHAGLRRVVRQPLDTSWQVEAKWRLAQTSEG